MIIKNKDIKIEESFLQEKLERSRRILNEVIRIEEELINKDIMKEIVVIEKNIENRIKRIKEEYGIEIKVTNNKITYK